MELNSNVISLFHWPQLPPLAPPGRPVLIRVAAAAIRAVAREQLRVAARQILAAWSGRPAHKRQWHETSHGPVYESQIGGLPVAISFSYSGDGGWIGLLRGGAIGVDAMLVAPFAEMDAVARLYLGPATAAAITAAADPARAFALAWTKHEARLKCHRRGL
ncbi:MAG: 4-phosphopantetheinyl transferase, partial [Opitutus sp.]|nr:4-phosphopantetheinyl transferase [Opitutus sp.]